MASTGVSKPTPAGSGVPSTVVRRVTPDRLELRTVGNTRRAFGYAVKFSKFSEDLGGFVEAIMPGAFAKTIRTQDVRCLFNHEPSWLLGRSKAGTLRLSEDTVGLWYEVDLPDTSVGNDVARLLERGDVVGSSFAFHTVKDDWSRSKSGERLRVVVEATLRDVGPVTFPAYPDSTSQLRRAPVAVKRPPVRPPSRSPAPDPRFRKPSYY